MVETKMIVSDALLRALSAETQKVGRNIRFKNTALMPVLSAHIHNVIILPQSEFYRHKFMELYALYNQNAVKALKELSSHFPFTPDYELGIGFVVRIRQPFSDMQGQLKIFAASDFELIETQADVISA